MNLFEYDKSLGYSLLCGVDEAGRGPLAGDVYAAAVILPPDACLPGLDDSKKLTEKKREQLYDEIIRQAVAYCVASASAEEIDRLNILQATFLAMQRAVEGLAVKPDYILIDGNRTPPSLNVPCGCLVKGDATSASIAAASVLAKVSRDRAMQATAPLYPEYGFEKHKGYPTKEHYAAILEYGVSPIHRKTFLKKMLNAEKPNAHLRGVIGENAAKEEYLSRGFHLAAKNYHSPYGEIDLVLRDEKTLVFCEVKARAQDSLVSPAEAVNLSKQRKIIKTALHYISAFGMRDEAGNELQPRFDVAEVTLDGSRVHSVSVLENAFEPDSCEFFL